MTLLQQLRTQADQRITNQPDPLIRADITLTRCAEAIQAAINGQPAFLADAAQALNVYAQVTGLHDIAVVDVGLGYTRHDTDTEPAPVTAIPAGVHAIHLGRKAAA